VGLKAIDFSHRFFSQIPKGVEFKNVLLFSISERNNFIFRLRRKSSSAPDTSCQDQPGNLSLYSKG